MDVANRIDFVAVARDPGGLTSAPKSVGLPVIDWWDGQFVRMRWYGMDYLIFANSGWNEASFRQPITVGVTAPTPQFYRSIHSIVIEVWSAPGGKAKYVAGQPPDSTKDMIDTDGLWTFNQNLLIGTFPRWPGIPMPVSDIDPRSL